MNILLLMMGGSGVRFGAKIPKQYIENDGMPIFMYTLEKYMDSRLIDKVVIVSNESWMDYTRQKVEMVLKNKLAGIVKGGETRSHSVKNGLDLCNEFADKNDLILIHDATNPFVDLNAIIEAIDKAKKSGASVVGTNQYHTIYNRTKEDSIVDFIPRETVGSGYSPEIFKFSIVYPFYENAKDEILRKMTSTVALVLGYNVDVKFVPADLVNIKITYPNDLKLFLAMVEYEKSEKHK